MKNLFRVLFILWAGSLWSSIWVAFALFHTLPDRHWAGMMFAKLFSFETYLSLLIGLFALLAGRARRFMWGYAALALLAVNEWALKPVMEQARLHGAALRLSFAAWHGISALLYLLACLAVLLLAWRGEVLKSS